MFARRALTLLVLAACCITTGAVFGASQAVTFQGKTYDVTFLTPDVNVPSYNSNDLIFLQDSSNNKFLVIPTDQSLRGDYDIVRQRFYILVNAGPNNFNIEAFNRINGTVLDLNAHLINTITQDITPPIEVYQQPILISETAQDICIVNDGLIGFRTDSPGVPTTLDEKIYTITRLSNSAVQSQFNVPLHNATLPFVAFDPNNQTYLTVQRVLDPTLGVNADTRRRISAFNSADGSLNSEIILDNLDVSLGFSGITGGMTIDPSTGIIYLLDAGRTTPTVLPRKIFTFTPRVPQLTAIAPNKGSFKGGTNVTISGQNFPPDAQVFFDNLPASNVVVNSLTSITCTTPAHSVGAVDVSIIGTGIATQLTLPQAYTYINTPPSAALTASPTSGPPPLTVSFNIGGSTDLDGSLVSRVITFGDGQSFTFPTDLTVVDTTHIYLANGTFTATLTVTDDLGATGSATQTIIVGTGGDDISDNNLVLRQLAFTLKGGSNDSMKIRAEFILPADVSLGDATVTVGVSGGQSGGAEFDTVLNSDGNKPIGNPSFSLRLLNKRGFDPNTYTLTFSKRNSSIKDALTSSGLNLTKSGPAIMTVFVRVVTSELRTITHTKPAAVVTVVASKNAKSSIKLVRK